MCVCVPGLQSKSLFIDTFFIVYRHCQRTEKMGFVMNTAYVVHGALVSAARPVFGESFVLLSSDQKLYIKDCIQEAEEILSLAFSHNNEKQAKNQ